MRSRQGVLHCVGCRLNVRHEVPGADSAALDAADVKVSHECHLRLGLLCGSEALQQTRKKRTRSLAAAVVHERGAR